MKKGLANRLAVRIAVGLLLLSSLGAGRAGAQVTYEADAVLFRCQAVTQAQVHLAFSEFNCRGVFFNNRDIEVLFNGQFNGIEVVSNSGKWTVYGGSIRLVSFDQPDPFYCPVTRTVTGYTPGCPTGSTPGHFSFTWGGVDESGVMHSGSITGAWRNVQYMGGTKAWYYPVLEATTITIN